MFVFVVLEHCSGNVLELMAEFKSVTLVEVEANTKYCDAKRRHYFGLAKSLIISVRRMGEFCDAADASSLSTRAHACISAHKLQFRDSACFRL